jgi:predicted  nucleic acid-binding Zn-ribbon protein
MKAFIGIIAFSLSLAAFSSEIQRSKGDTCSYFMKREAATAKELSDLYHEIGKLHEEGNYSSVSSEEGCEGSMDQSSYLSRRIERVRAQLEEVQKSVRQYCRSGGYPE